MISCIDFHQRLKAVILLTCCLILLTSASLYSQSMTTKSKRAEKFYRNAAASYQDRQYDAAIQALNEAIHEDSLFVEAHLLLGDVYADQKETTKAIAAYRHAVRVNRDYYPTALYFLGELERSVGQYQAAIDHYRLFLTYRNTPKDKRDKSETGIKACENALALMAHPVPFRPVNLGNGINTPDDEYINAITADEEVLIFTRRFERFPESQLKRRNLTEDFFIARRQKEDSIWQKVRNLGPPINTEGNEGALCMSPDGLTIIFAACYRPDGMGSCDLYYSRRTGEEWSEPENLGPVVNSEAWDSQPSLSPDGATLYYSSSRKGSRGRSDIWKTTYLGNGSWGRPENLGDTINTPGEEMCPFIHPDDQTLYFSSEGHPGMGGMDLYITRKKPDGTWGTPKNMGYPINTWSDEISLIVNAKGDRAFISSDKLGGAGQQDIYSFPLHAEVRPLLVNYLKGVVFDKESRKRLDARFELIDLETGSIVTQSNSDAETGEFLVTIPTSRKLALNVSREGYLFYSDNFEIAGETSAIKPFLKDIPLSAIKVGESVVLRNIFFETAQYTLKDESRIELDRLAGLLERNPKIRIEIGGHTDNVGGESYNNELSLNRARAVYEYLVTKGISKDRLSYKGYGYSQPVDSNDTEAGRANNRRTAFRIVASN